MLPRLRSNFRVKVDMTSPTPVDSLPALAVGVGTRLPPDDGEGIDLDRSLTRWALATVLGRGSEDSARAKTAEQNMRIGIAE